MQKIKTIWWLSLVIKIILAVTIPLSQDESYYWVWSKNLQLSYFDHPPMVSWLLWCGNFLENFYQAIRLPHLLIGHLTIWIWIHILRNFLSLSPDKIQTWMLLVLACPLLGIGSFIATPDVSLLFFWSLATLLSFKILKEGKSLHYALLGGALGLGFLSKYHIVLFVPALVVNLFFYQNYLRIRWTGILLTILIGLISCAPVLIWNYQNEFKSFSFQIQHGFGESTWDPFWTYSYILGQFLLIFPTVFYSAVRVKVNQQNLLLLLLAWLPLLFFAISSFRGPVEMNWPVASLASVFALALIADAKPAFLKVGYIFWTILSLFIVLQSYYPFFSSAPEKMNEVRYFDPVLQIQENYKPVYFGSYQMAARMWWETKIPQKKLYQINRPDFFDELNPSPPSESVFHVIKENWVPFPKWLNEDNYTSQLIQNVGEKFQLFQIEAK